MKSRQVFFFSFAALCFINSSCVVSGILLPHGDKEGDDHHNLTRNGTICKQLNGSYFFAGKTIQDTICISENGMVSFGYEYPGDEIPDKLPLHTPALIAGFWTDILTNDRDYIYYDEMVFSSVIPTREGLFGRRHMEVMGLIENFDTTDIVVVSWVFTTYCDTTNPVKFQIVLVTDSNTNRTYVLLLYDVIGNNICNTNVLVGFSAGDGCHSYTHPVSKESITDLAFNAFIYRIDEGGFCGDLNTPTNGMIQFTTRAAELVATYTCDEKYNLVGNSERTCLLYGEWSGSDPICDAHNCGDLVDPDNGHVEYDSKTEGSMATYTCNNNCEPVGCSTQTCEGGEWSGAPPTCPDPMCGGLQAQSNGTVHFSVSPAGYVGTFVCDDGYKLIGNSERLCLCNGQWSGDNPTCEVDCGPLEDPANGQVCYTSTLLGSVATYTCDSGCEPDGYQTRTCTDSGWSEDEPICPDIRCGNLKSPSNGMLHYSSNCSGLVAKYECDEQTVPLIGNRERVCQCDGTWSGDDPFCCGGELKGSHGYFETPQWPGSYPQVNFICKWTAVNTTTVMIFEFDREVYGINGNDYIEFFDTPDNSVGKFSSDSLDAPEPIIIYTGCATIVFKGTVDLDHTDNRKGVRIKYMFKKIRG